MKSRCARRSACSSSYRFRDHTFRPAIRASWRNLRYGDRWKLKRQYFWKGNETMNEKLTGLHHVTAITGNARTNVEFYAQKLGLRLVKKTVNQDDVSAYHLFYGDELGRPGTELTFFDWPAAGPNHEGTGTIAEIALRVGGGREALI